MIRIRIGIENNNEFIWENQPFSTEGKRYELLPVVRNRTCGRLFTPDLPRSPCLVVSGPVAGLSELACPDTPGRWPGIERMVRVPATDR